MRLGFAMLTSLLLNIGTANGASIFSPDAIFDFEPEGVVATSPSTGSGSGAYDTDNPVIEEDAGIMMTVLRVGRETRYDVKELDDRFPSEWGSGALDPSVNIGDGSFCNEFVTTGCDYFLTEFTAPKSLMSAEIDFGDLSGSPGESDRIELKALRDGDPFADGIPVQAYYFLNGARDPNFPIAVGPDGVVRLDCDPSECGIGKFVTVSILAESGSFRSLLFRGFGVLDDEAINSQSMYADNIRVGLIPEPTTLALFGFSAAALFGLARWRRE
jgi:hypothetical protein